MCLCGCVFLTMPGCHRNRGCLVVRVGGGGAEGSTIRPLISSSVEQVFAAVFSRCQGLLRRYGGVWGGHACTAWGWEEGASSVVLPINHPTRVRHAFIPATPAVVPLPPPSPVSVTFGQRKHPVHWQRACAAPTSPGRPLPATRCVSCAAGRCGGRSDARQGNHRADWTRPQRAHVHPASVAALGPPRHVLCACVPVCVHAGVRGEGGSVHTLAWMRRGLLRGRCACAGLVDMGDSALVFSVWIWHVDDVDVCSSRPHEWCVSSKARGCRRHGAPSVWCLLINMGVAHCEEAPLCCAVLCCAAPTAWDVQVAPPGDPLAVLMVEGQTRFACPSSGSPPRQ
jgi:hypothetical protein